MNSTESIKTAVCNNGIYVMYTYVLACSFMYKTLSTT